jgi:hypothetical protein
MGRDANAEWNMGGLQSLKTTGSGDIYSEGTVLAHHERTTPKELQQIVRQAD